MTTADGGGMPPVHPRFRFAARLLGVLLILGLVNLAANLFYSGVVVWSDIAYEPDAGLTGAIAVYLFFSLPGLLQAAGSILMIREGARGRNMLSVGSEWGRDQLHRLSYWCFGGLVLVLLWTGLALDKARHGRGIDLEPGQAAAQIAEGEPSWVAWLGASSLAATVLLMVGAVAMAVATRRVRPKPPERRHLYAVPTSS